MKKNEKIYMGRHCFSKKNAPRYFHPGQIASICGMIKIKSKKLADKYKSNIGEWIYTIEYIGGLDIEIPECYLEPHQEENEKAKMKDSKRL